MHTSTGCISACKHTHTQACSRWPSHTHISAVHVNTLPSAPASEPLPPTQNTASTLTHPQTHTPTPPILSIHYTPILASPAFSLHPSTRPFLPCSRLWRLSCACWCSSSTHSGLLHEPNTFTLCCHGDLKWAALPPPPLLLPPPPLLWLPSPWLLLMLLLPPRLPLSASRPLVAGGGREQGKIGAGEGGRDVEKR